MPDQRFHEVANVFPLMDDDALATLAADIAANGLREPIWRHADGRVIDGRNRLIACERVGVEATSRTWDGNGSLLAFVISLNLHRRHLNASQRGMIAAEIAKLPAGHPTNNPKELLTQPDAAAPLNVGLPTLKRARLVLEDGTSEEIATVKRGERSVTSIANGLRAKRSEAKRQKKATAPSKPRAESRLIDALTVLLTELRAKRKRNLDERGRRRWNPMEINTRVQTEMLNWMESALDTLISQHAPEQMHRGSRAHKASM